MEQNAKVDQLLPEHSIHTDISSVTQENEAVNYNLLDRLDKDELTELRKYFFEKKIDEKIKEPKGSAHPRFLGFKLSKNEFVDAVNKVIGNSTYALTAAKLFEDITKDNWEQHQGFIWWEQILDAIIDNTEKQTFHRKWDVIREPLSALHTIQHCRRETIIRVVPIETDTSFCYVIVSKYGRIGLYDWCLQLLEQYEVKLGAQAVSSLLNTEVRRTTWLTDAVYLQDAVMLLLSASDRSLHFYSASGLVHVPTFHISGLPNIPTCLSYTPGPTSDDPSVLFIGDDHGSIITMKFHQAEYCLFQRNNSDKIDTYFWKELESQSEWVTTTVDTFVHTDEVIKIEYFSDNNSIVSCSNDPKATLVIRHLTGKRAPYIFKISRQSLPYINCHQLSYGTMATQLGHWPRKNTNHDNIYGTLKTFLPVKFNISLLMFEGVRCFHLDRVLKLIVTGSKDSVVRLWNPVMTKKPVGSLFGHRCAVVDVRIIRNHEAVLSMSKDATLMVWDIQDQCCLQVLQALFPGYHEVGRTADFGVQTFYPGPIRSEPPVGKGPKLPLTEPNIQRSHPASLLSSASSETKKEQTYQQDKNVKNLECIQVATTQNENEEYQCPTNEKKKKSLTVVTDEHLNQDEAVFFNEDDLRVAKRMLTSQWNRLEVLVACCNYIVILYLGDGEIREHEDFMSGVPLPPPLREQDPAIPSPWLTADTHPLHLLHEVDGMSQRSSTPDLPSADSTADSIYKHLSYSTDYHFKPVVSPQHSLKAIKARQATTQRDVQALVEQCAPHLALNISQLEEIKITQRLPMTVRTHNYDLSNPEKLLKTKTKKNSAGTPTANSKSSNMPLDP